MATKFLEQAGLEELLALLKVELDKKILKTSISTTLTNTSVNTTVPGTKSVYDFVMEQIGNLVNFSAVVITWPDPLPATGDSNKFYLKQETATGPFHIFYYYSAVWHRLGVVDINMALYWAKLELVALTETEVENIFNTVMGL